MHEFTKFKCSTLCSRKCLWRMETVMKSLVYTFKTKEIAHSANRKPVSGGLNSLTGWDTTPNWFHLYSAVATHGCSDAGFSLALLGTAADIGGTLTGTRKHTIFKHTDVFLHTAVVFPSVSALLRRAYCVSGLKPFQTQKHRITWWFPSIAAASAIARVTLHAVLVLDDLNFFIF